MNEIGCEGTLEKRIALVNDMVSQGASDCNPVGASIETDALRESTVANSPHATFALVKDTIQALFVNKLPRLSAVRFEEIAVIVGRQKGFQAVDRSQREIWFAQVQYKLPFGAQLQQLGHRIDEDIEQGYPAPDGRFSSTCQPDVGKFQLQMQQVAEKVVLSGVDVD